MGNEKLFFISSFGKKICLFFLAVGGEGGDRDKERKYSVNVIRMKRMLTTDKGAKT